jgi:alanine racemase
VSLEQAKEIAEIGYDKKLKVHLKIDTGLNRFGLSPIQNSRLDISEILAAIQLLKSNHNINIEGIYSHMAAVEEDVYDDHGQQELMYDTIKELKKKNIEIPIKHLAASAATMMMSETHFDLVRCGIAIYGLWPSLEVKKAFLRIGKTNDFLKPVLSYKTHIVAIKKVERHSKIGYGRTFTAKKDMIIGVLPIGYYEGLDRGLSNNGEVLVCGKRCPIVGRICMNISIVDVTGITAKVGDEVVIIGKQGDLEITVDDMAEKLGTINYEVVTGFPEHLKRIYV